MALETALSVGAGVVMVQEPLIGNQEISHIGFNFYWLQGERKNIKVMMAVRKSLVDKIVDDYRTDLDNCSYFILLKIRELDPRSKRPGRKTSVVNVYDNG